MASMTEKELPANRSAWIEYYTTSTLMDDESTKNHETTTMFTTGAKMSSGSKINDSQFALLRICCKPTLAFDKKTGSVNFQNIVQEKYHKEATHAINGLARESQSLKAYLNWVRRNPGTIAREDEGEKLGRYHLLHESQAITYGLRDKFDDRGLDFSPPWTRLQEKLGVPQRMPVDGASRQTLGLQSALGVNIPRLPIR